MTSKQRYLFDLNGYLHIKNVLSDEELREAQQAVERCVRTSPDQLPHGRNFAFDKSLEALTMHPVTWPIVKELTDDKPRFNRGSLVVETHEKQTMTPFHCAREDCGWQTRRYEVRNGRIFCNDIIAFFYFTDVYPGDGGLLVLPGSHKSEFQRPDGLFLSDLEDPNPVLHSAIKNITPRAGDVVVLSELTTHGVLVWKPKDRDRRFLILRYKTQYFQDHQGERYVYSKELMDKLSPETQELMSYESYWHDKKIVKCETVDLS